MHSARPGDRVVVPVRVGEDFEAEALSTRLREKGVEVELRPERNAMPSGGGGSDVITSAPEVIGSDGLPVSQSASGEVFGPGDDLDPLRVFSDYMGGIDLSALMEADAKASKGSKEQLSEMARLALHSAVLEEGRSTIERLMSSEALGDNQLGDSVKGSRLYNLKLDRLSLQNFGPYGGAPVDYPLSDRGLVLIRGQSTDGTGADSNGSGKVYFSSLLNTISRDVIISVDYSCDECHVGVVRISRRAPRGRRTRCGRGVRHWVLLRAGQARSRCGQAHGRGGAVGNH